MEHGIYNIFSRLEMSDSFLGLFLTCTAASLICGIIIAAAFSYRKNIGKSLTFTLLILPTAVQTVIMMVNGNLGTGVAVAGAFSLVRFRSAPGKAQDIAAIFLSMAAGLASAAGYPAIAVLFSFIVCGVYLIVSQLPSSSEGEYDLRITVPESLNFYGVFDDIFKKYTRTYRTVSVKTSNMGTLYKLHYKIVLISPEQCRELIDELRCRNGNLEISLSKSEISRDEL